MQRCRERERRFAPSWLPVFFLLLLTACAGTTQRLRQELRPYPDSHFVPVEGVRMHYRDMLPEGITTATGLPVAVLIHGLASNTITWYRIAPALQPGRRLILIDLKGFGYSAKPLDDDYRIQTQEKLVLDLLDALQIRKADFIGHSMGGATVHAIAINHPERVRSVVLISGAIPPHAPHVPFGAGTLGRLAHEAKAQEFAQLMLARWMVNLSYNFVVQDRKFVDDELIDGLYFPMTRPGSLHAMASALYWTLDFFARGEEIWKPLTMPAGMIWSDSDPIAPFEIATLLQAADPAIVTTIIHNEGHNIQEEVPEQVLPSILAVLERGAATVAP